MDNTNIPNTKRFTDSEPEQAMVPDSFKTLCRMIMNQSVTYSDAWNIVKDIVAADRRSSFIPSQPLIMAPFTGEWW